MIGITVLALACVLLSGYLASKLSAQERRIRLLEQKIVEIEPLVYLDHALPGGQFAKPPLENLRVAIQVQQDHERPIFALLLRDRLIAEDALVSVVDTTESVASDILIRGKIKCNGYEEMFFEAIFDCLSQDALVLTVSEKPTQGGRQSNLANSVVMRLKQELQRSSERRERIQALDQLES